MGIAKRDALLLVAKMEKAITEALEAWERGRKEDFNHYQGYAVCMVETVETLVGDRHDLHRYLHGRYTFLLAKTSMAHIWHSPSLQFHEGFVIRPLANGSWYACGATPFGMETDYFAAQQQVDAIRSLFALPKLPAKEGC